MLANPKPFAGKYRTLKPILPTLPAPPKPHVRHTPKPASLNPAQTGFAPKPPTKQYTGTNCLGIAAMHKSNLVPVFTADQAIDTATMRRN